MQAAGGQQPQRVLEGVGVDVADDDHVGVGGLQLRDEAQQRAGLRDAGGVPAALAVAEVGVGRVEAGGGLGRRAAGLGLEVHRDDAEALAVGGGEGLRQRRAAVHRVGVAQRRADRRKPPRAVDDRVADCVAAAALRRQRYRCPGAGAGHRIQLRDEVGDGRVAVVLELLQADDVGLQAEDRRHQLGALAGQLGGAVGAAAVGARAAGQAGRAGLVDRREVVQHVEAGDADVAADRRRRRRPRVAAGEARRLGRVEAVVRRARQRGRRQAVVDDAGEAVDAVAGAHGGLGAEVGRGVGVLARAAVVEDQAAQVVVERGGDGLRRARRVQIGRVGQARAGAQRELAEAAEEEVLRDDQRPGDMHQHALDALEFAVVGLRQRDDGRRDLVPAADDVKAGSDDARQRALQRALAGAGGELLDQAGDADQVTDGSRAGTTGVDEDAVGGRRVAVADRVLHEEAVAVQRGDDAARRHRLPGQRAERAGALDLRDRHDRVDADLDAAVGALPGIVGEAQRHAVAPGRQRRGDAQRDRCNAARGRGRTPVGQREAGRGVGAERGTVDDAVGVAGLEPQFAAVAGVGQQRRRAVRRDRGVEAADRAAADGDVVDADPLVGADGVGGEDAQLDFGLVVDRGRQRRRDQGLVAGEVGAARGIGDVGRRHVGEGAAAADPPLQRDRLHGVVGRAVEVAQAVGDADVALAAGVEVDDEVRRARGARALQRDRRVGQREGGDAAGGQGIRRGLVDQHMDPRRAGAEHGLRIDPGGGGERVAAKADDARHARPIVGGGRQRRRGPVLHERQALRNLVGQREAGPGRGRGEEGCAGDGPQARGARKLHGDDPSGERQATWRRHGSRACPGSSGPDVAAMFGAGGPHMVRSAHAGSPRRRDPPV